MTAVEMFFGGLLVGPIFAFQAGLAWCVVVAVLRLFGHFLGNLLPAPRWQLWPILRVGYVFLMAMLLFAAFTGGSTSSGSLQGPSLVAAIAGIAASFAAAILVRQRVLGEAEFPFRSFEPGRASSAPAAPVTDPTWALPPEPDDPARPRPSQW